MRKRFLVVCIFFLLVISSIGSLSFGDKLTDKEVLTDNNSTPQSLDGLMNSSWPMYCHDVRHTSQSEYSTTDISDIEKWRLKSDWIDGGIVIGNNDMIYFGDCNNYLYAIFPNGTKAWQFKTGNWIKSTPAIGEDGTIYVGSLDCKLYAINANGTKKWSVDTGGAIYSSPVIGNDGTIYLGNYADKIFAINPNGTIKWYYTTDDDITSDPAIDNDGIVYIGSVDNYLYALYQNGTLKWRFKTGDRIYGSPSIANDGTVYVGSSWDSYLYALNPNGTLKWKYAGAGTPNNPSIGSDGTIYAGYLYNLLAIYPNGTLKWDFYIGDNRYIGASAPAISADVTIYFGVHLGTPGNSDGGEIIALNSDGSERWRKKISSYWIDSSPCIAEDGTVYIGSSYNMAIGYLHAFGTPDDNEPPSQPVITGETHGKPGTSYTYNFVSNDPEGYPVKYYIDWGDNNNTDWTWEYGSSEEVTFSYIWTNEGTYTIKAKSMDISNDESDWGTLEVIIPRNRIATNNMLLRFLERFPLLEKLLYNFFL